MSRTVFNITQWGLVGLLGLGIAGCSSKKNLTEPVEMATLWWQTSGEARALQYQAYHWAQVVLERDLRDKKKKGARAVVVDIDETVLDNGAYEGAVVLTGKAFPEQWDTWVDKREAKPVPGSLEFLTFAASKGVKIFYVTNRDQRYQAATIDNLKKLGYPDANETSVMCSKSDWSKEARRNEIRKTHRIVLLVGDNLNDFSGAYEKKNVEDRFAAVEKERAKFGEEFIVIPNPMYGDWEGALYHFDWKKSPEEKAKLRREYIKGF